MSVCTNMHYRTAESHNQNYLVCIASIDWLKTSDPQGHLENVAHN